MGEILYGSELAAKLRQQMKELVESYKVNSRLPKLAVILVGNDPASCSYVKGKEKACLQIGVLNETIHLDASISQDELLSIIDKLNKDETVDGILVQLPLPKSLDQQQVIEAIDPRKDVDGLTTISAGKFFTHKPGFKPCTPSGVMEILKEAKVEINGKHAVVVGRSQLVGNPVAQLLLNANATVTMCHSKTINLPQLCKQADILVVAMGKPKYITKEYIKPGAVVIDVGVNRVDGKLCGDVDFDNVKDIASIITPVPKGVGPMTITMLLYNTIKAYNNNLNTKVD